MPINSTTGKNTSQNGAVYIHSSGHVELSQGKNTSYSGSSSKTTHDDHDDDDDLKSLIRNNNHNTTKQQQQQYYDNDIPSNTNCCTSTQGVLRYQLHNCCFFYPITCTIVSILIVSICLWLLVGTVLFNPYEQFGINDGHDHSNIQSKYDLQLQQIDHFCLGGQSRHNNRTSTSYDYDCTCENPLEPYARVEYTSWILAYKTNLLKIEQQYINPHKNPDVAFLGSSIVEEMEGRWMGITGRTVGLKKLSSIYQQNFGTSSTINGITLGIAGDTSPNILWRIMNGEMSTNFNPKVWWLVLGMNDLARTKCSEEVTLLGILRIVEEILERKPDTHIVINSLLPMTALRGDDYPVFSEVQDSFSGGDTAVIDKDQSLANNNNKHRRRRHLATIDPDDETNLEEMKKLKDLEVQAEQEEKQRDKKHTRKKTTRTHKNILMKDKKKIKKFKPGHIRQNTLPLWTSIQAINNALQKFVSKHSDRVSYFDADNLFVVRDTNNNNTTTKKGTIKTRLRTDRTTSKGHPTISGFVAYEEKINTYLQKLLVDLHFDKRNKNSNVVLPNLGTDDQFLNSNTDNSNSNDDEYEYDDEYLKEDDDGWKSILNSVRDDNSNDNNDEGNESTDTETIIQPSTGDDDLFGYDELLRPDENDFNNDDKRYDNTDDF